MKAIERNGKISVLKNLPSTMDIGGKLYMSFNKLPKEDLEALGYYDLVKPSIDKDTQSLGNVYFDADNSVFTREIIEKDFTATYEDEDGNVLPSYDLDAKKSELIGKLKGICGSMLQPTDWQVTRLAERGTAIDAEVALERQKILNKCDTKEIEVNALDSFLGALKYNTSFYTEQVDENGEVIVDEMGNPILAI